MGFFSLVVVVVVVICSCWCRNGVELKDLKEVAETSFKGRGMGKNLRIVLC